MKNGWIKNFTPPITSKFVGQLIGVNLLFPKLDQYYMRVKGGLTFFVALIYHPVDEKDYEEFNDELNDIFQQIPESVEFIGGCDVNVNVGLRNKMYGSVLGTYGIDNRNKKGHRLL